MRLLTDIYIQCNGIFHTDANRWTEAGKGNSSTQ